MQEQTAVRIGTEELIDTVKLNHHYQSWQEKPCKPKPRSNLYAHRYTEPVRVERDSTDAVARSPESIGQGADLHYFCTSDGRVYLIGQAEDSDIDDTQSQRWRGG